ncbi:MAG: hypothetical protein P4L51_13550 [Puia sp.]|nr:hypothetical protein [Puia sp.]
MKLFIEEVLGSYEKAVLEDFSETMGFAAGVKRIWLNVFRYCKNNRPAFALMQYGKSSPLLNCAFQAKNIKEGHYFAPVHQFLRLHVAEDLIKDFPVEVHRALLFSPLPDLINEYFEHLDRPVQIVT